MEGLETMCMAGKEICVRTWKTISTPESSSPRSHFNVSGERSARYLAEHPRDQNARAHRNLHPHLPFTDNHQQQRSTKIGFAASSTKRRSLDNHAYRQVFEQIG
ncbi:hypothetical protein H2204_009913 [Knufia peltigerae]|uniref:Uncharacterized protein n=1 Tax=Knufia peltigerae TaxID=1002370 RepID=A0AA38XX34_9EURO|nr:hypothetical protein H2204_009913 [Knufia peltigerae]